MGASRLAQLRFGSPCRLAPPLMVVPRPTNIVELFDHWTTAQMKISRNRRLWVVSMAFATIALVLVNANERPNATVLARRIASLDTNNVFAVSYKDDRGIPQIYLVSPDGESRVQLTWNSFACTRPMWSPDGRRIVYVGHGNDQVRIINANGMEDRGLCEYRADGSAINTTPVWSRDGSEIFYAAGVRTVPDPRVWPNTHIWAVRPDGTGRRQITEGDFADVAPSFSPDGMHLVVASSRNGGVFRIWKMRSDGKNPVQLTWSGMDQSTGYPIEQNVPAWSPDGKQIAYWNGVEMSHLSLQALQGKGPTQDDLKIARTCHINLMNADGSNPQQLVGGDDPVWSPDCSHILFPGSNNNPLKPGVGIIGTDGAGARLLISTGDHGPSGVSCFKRPAH